MLDVPSALELVGPAVELLVNALPANFLPERRIRFNLRTALAEALSNAICYGNRHDVRKVVQVRAEVRSDALHVHVVDEGEGFKPDAVPDPTLPENREREDGRGLFVLRHIVDRVSFNEKGNAVCLTLLAG
ncbi:MAG TPA: ATP-binding protein [Gemmatimonadales bacterium]|nr:ATP-binding protein [Gemmatimonadales bacterium]